MLPSAASGAERMDHERIGNYDIVAVLGRGTMGEVLKALDRNLNRYVALKRVVASGGLGDEAFSRFKTEAQAAALLNHPNIVTIHEFGRDRGQLFIAMELLEGEDLREALDRGRSFSLDEKLEIVDGVLKALEYAHGKGVVHRDVKPANIHLVPGGLVKIMDFGLARLGSSELTQDGVVLGTPNYMSPEQALGARVDGRSDLFAVGVVMYELLTGHKPFEAESTPSVLYQVVHTEPPPVRRWAPDAPDLLVALVERALHKDRERRFASATEMRAALSAARPGGSTAPTRAALRPPPLPARGDGSASRSVRMAGAPPVLAQMAATATPASGVPAISATPASGVPAVSATPAFGVPAMPRTPAFGVPAISPTPASGVPAISTVNRAVAADSVSPAAAAATGPPVPEPIPTEAAAPPAAPLEPAAAPETPSGPELRLSVSPPGRDGRLALIVGGGLATVVVAAILVLWLRPQPGAPAPPTAGEQVGVLRQALVATQLQLAGRELEDKDYAAAARHAESVLRLAPSHGEAARLLAEARGRTRELEAAIASARALADQGDTAAASRQLSRVLELDPRQPAAAELSARLNSAFAAQAEQAAAAMRSARAQAESTGVSGTGDFAAASEAARAATALAAGGEYAEAARGFLQARDGFDRARHAAESRLGPGASRQRGTPPAAVRFEAEATAVQTAAAGQLAGFERDGVTAHRPPEFSGQLLFEVVPETLHAGDPFVVRIQAANQGGRSVHVRSLSVATIVDGRRTPVAAVPLARELPARHRTLVAEYSDVWRETSSWTLEAVVTSERDETITARLRSR